MTDLQRVQREQRQRRATFVDFFDMGVLTDLASEKYPPELVFITGGVESLPGPDVLIDEALADGWKVRPYVNVSEREGERRLQATYHRSGTAIEVRSAAEWIGPDLHSGLAQRAWTRLRRDLQALFGEHAVLLSSPAQTGQDLLERSLPRQRGKDGSLTAYTFPAIPAPVAEMLYATCGQGRNELFPHDARIDRLYGLDGVWMYAACLSGLPNGPLTMDTKDTPPGHATGFLVASVRVPDEWAHIGLLPEVYDGDDGKTHRRWPRTPGQWFSSVMTTSEYELADAQGWDVRIKRRYLWAAPQCNPARIWQEKLVALRNRYDIAASRGDIVAKALSGTVRGLILRTIGLWFSHEAHEDGFIRREEVPAFAAQYPDAHLTPHGRHHFAYRIPRAPEEKVWRHPEWAAQVWGRARRKLAANTLGLPFGAVVSLRTDCIWSVIDPGWQGDTPGSFRLKDIIDGPLSAPRNETDMRALLTMARRV